jgi:hypothetical protein
LKYLLISAPPRVKIPKSYEEGVILEIGEVIRLKATFSGRPIPIVHWLHNGEEVKIAINDIQNSHFPQRYEFSNLFNDLNSNN